MASGIVRRVDLPLLRAARRLLLPCLLLAACAPASPSATGTSDGSELSHGLSYVGQAVLRELDGGEATRDWRGKTWDVTTDNELPDNWLQVTPDPRVAPGLAYARTCSASEDACDPAFLLLACSSDYECGPSRKCAAVHASVTAPGGVPVQLCVSHSDGLVDDVYDVITSAESFVDLTSLAAPTGRFETGVRNALTYLGQTGRRVDVRLLFGNYPTQLTNTDALLASLTRDLPTGHALRVTIGAFRSSATSWNHAKIVAADGKRAFVGGHNLWQDDYLDVDPVSDLSMFVTGSAAATAQRYADELWAYECGDSWNVTTSHGISGTKGSSCPPAFARVAPVGAGHVAVIGVGRLGAAGSSNASDAAILAMLGAAKQTIRLSQQDLGPPHLGILQAASWPTPILQALVAALGRGVDVSLVLSDYDVKAHGGNPYSLGWKPEDVAAKIYETAEASPASFPAGTDVRALLCAHLHVAPLRLSSQAGWADGNSFANHMKLVVVDEVGFYIGSQNLYPADLAEFGYLVDDAPATADLVAKLWAPIWVQSARDSVTGNEASSCSLR